MLRYILKRLGRSLVTLFFIVTIIFALLRLMPEEGYIKNYDKLSPAQIESTLVNLGLRDPLHVQLGKFYQQLLHLDLGVSHRYQENVSINKIIAYKAPISIRLGLLSMAVALAVGVPMGILMARSTRTRWKLWDKFGTLFIVFVQAVPSAVYYLLIQIYGTKLFGVPMLFDASNWRCWVLPVLSLALGNIAYYAMWLRRYMVDESNKDYVKLARAKGVSSSNIMKNHILRNAIVPMVQYLPGSLLFTMCGSIYVESLYSIPGMGGLLVDVIKRQDNTMVQALVLIFAVIGILGLLLGDILMAIVDPRISFTKKEGSR